MKKISKVFCVSALVVLVVSACGSLSQRIQYSSPADWVEKTKSGPTLGLAEKEGIWSDPKTFNTQSGSPVAIQSKFVKHFGTTCIYHVQFTNNGSGNLDESVTLGSNVTGAVFDHRLTRVRLTPGQSVAYKMEQRECDAIWGSSTDMSKCAACSPYVIFLKR